jgi:cystathionine beta-lyase/cystathionine gamma-synthase
MTDPRLGASAPLVPPLYQSAVYALPDLDALDTISDGHAPGYIYLRDGHPNAHILADQLAAVESAKWGVVTGSGMGAISAACLALLNSGDRVIASNRLYGKTTKLLRQEFRRFGVPTTVVDTCDLDAVKAAFAAGPARLLLTETISNPTCRVADIPALAETAHAHGCRLLVDNTFATPVLCKPLTLGADLVMESLTKMIGGHSDVLLGFLGGADPDLFPGVTAAVGTWGLSANPFDCWLTARGLATLDLRMRVATANAAAVADWLAGQPGVAEVLYPGRPDHPDHALSKRLLPGGCGHMLTFELAGGRGAVNRFLRSAPGIPFCPSLGHTSTTCSYPAGTSHRHDSPAERARQGIRDGHVRLSVGCEPAEGITAELHKGLKEL